MGLEECGLRATAYGTISPNTLEKAMRPNDEGTPTTDAHRNYGPTGRRWIHASDYLLPPCPDCSLGRFLSCLCLFSLSLFPPAFHSTSDQSNLFDWRHLIGSNTSPIAWKFFSQVPQPLLMEVEKPLRDTSQICTHVPPNFTDFKTTFSQTTTELRGVLKPSVMIRKTQEAEGQKEPYCML